MRLSQAEFAIPAGMLDLPRARPRAPWVETSPIGAVPESWKPHWDRLAAEAAEPNCFAERWFTEAGAAHLPEAEGALLLALWSDEDRAPLLLGLLPVRIESIYGRFPVRHVQNWLHHNVLLGTPLVRPGHEIAFWTATLDALDAAPWAPGFLYVSGLVEDERVHRGLAEAARMRGRPCDTVHRRRRALLEGGVSSQVYFEGAVRKKKRKELKRLSARLGEVGEVKFERLAEGGDPHAWAEEFLTLEASGWKGRGGTALASQSETKAFFHQAFAAAEAAGRLDVVRMRVGDRTAAMQVNFVTPPGSFSFKIAIDEHFARFSPGVLLQIENLRVLDRGDVMWMDSCAFGDHPMIDSLWRERRTIVRVNVPLAGARRRFVFRLCRTLERTAVAARRLVGAESRGQ